MLNATLLVQAVHFCIAYVILDRILLRYGVHLIAAEKKKVVQLQHEIQQASEKVAGKAARNEREWHTARRELLDKKPLLHESEPLRVALPQRVCIIDLMSQEELEETIVKAQKALVERIDHD